MSAYTPYHSLYLANRITLEGVSDDAFAKSLSTARVEMNPHQVDAALFALQPPIPRGAILADEVGLGKTIEASLVIAQRWAERKRRILLIVPASLRKQWMQELHEKFGLSSVILEAKSYRERIKKGEVRPFEVENAIVVTSYEFGALKADDLAKTNWDLVIFDEAHRLRNVYRKGASKRAKALRDALRDKFKLLLTATPLQNSLMELFGLVSVVDENPCGIWSLVAAELKQSVLASRQIWLFRFRSDGGGDGGRCSSHAAVRHDPRGRSHSQSPRQRPQIFAIV